MRLHALALIALAAASCTDAGDRVRLVVETGAGGPWPETLSLTWFPPQGEPITRQLPATGTLPEGKTRLASVRVSLTAGDGERRVLVRGMRGANAAGVAADRFTPGRGYEEIVVRLVASLPDADGDGLPDVIDDPPGDGGVDQRPDAEGPDGVPPDLTPDLTADLPRDGSTPESDPRADLRADQRAEPDTRPDTVDAVPGDTVAPIAEDPALAVGVVGHWRLDDAAASTSARDWSGYGNAATLMGADPATAWVPGRVGGAVDLGARGYLQVNASPTISSPRTALTIAAWVNKTAAVAIDVNATIVSRSIPGTEKEYYGVFWRPDGRIVADINARDGGPMCGSRPVSPGAWHHVAVTLDAAALRVYIDGAEACVALGATLPTDAASPVLIGANRNDAVAERFFGGRMDEVLLYNRALPAAEIVRLAAGTRPTGR